MALHCVNNSALTIASSVGGPVRIAIVGAGAAGIFAAYNIEQAASVPLQIDILESSGRIGGNASSVTYIHPTTGYSTNIDAGAQFFFANPQPCYIELLKSAGLFNADIVGYPTGLCVWDLDRDGRSLFVPSLLGNFVDGTFKLTDLPSLFEFGLFLLAAEELDCRGDYSISVSDWLNTLPWLTRSFRQNVLIPFLYQFVSLPLNRIGEASAMYAVTYFVRNVTGWPGSVPITPNPGNTFTTYQSNIGLDGILKSIASLLKHSHITLNTAVTHVDYDTVAAKPNLTANGNVANYDVVIMTCDPPTALQLLQDSAAQKSAAQHLERIEYQPLHIMVDSNASLMPTDKGSWQAVNTVVSNEQKLVIFDAYFGMLRPLDHGNPIQVFKRCGDPNLSSPQTPPPVLADHSHTVLYPTVASVQARDALQALQGNTSVWFAGGWNTWFDSQEAAYRSTLPIVHQLEAFIDPAGARKDMTKFAASPAAARPGSVRAWLGNILDCLPKPAQRAFRYAIGQHFAPFK